MDVVLGGDWWGDWGADFGRDFAVGLDVELVVWCVDEDVSRDRRVVTKYSR